MPLVEGCFASLSCALVLCELGEQGERKHFLTVVDVPFVVDHVEEFSTRLGFIVECEPSPSFLVLKAQNHEQLALIASKPPAGDAREGLLHGWVWPWCLWGRCCCTCLRCFGGDLDLWRCEHFWGVVHKEHLHMLVELCTELWVLELVL